ncbi:hypothetical protein SAMN05660443_1091 [Marinospirillum celere]|uniref:Uncharacterized protein n=1 Tax=Marinospirillum celere TaxID=1122252 RepID=A0A1I1FRM1_9GAMM|nr:DUF1249 domain-containing protein [Marinospirillum celere]SFC00258.1 hypothetical protein SAMN05660443_1091 [Marinospirillum celere]
MRRYVAELQRLQRDAAANYLLLQRLWPGQTQEQVVLGLRSAGRDLGSMSLRQLEKSRWTELLELRLDIGNSHPHLYPAVMQIRSYHDVRLTEVIAFQQRQAREGRYAYPNDAMFHPDEKVQVNDFLRELLRFALDKGYSLAVEIDNG